MNVNGIAGLKKITVDHLEERKINSYFQPGDSVKLRVDIQCTEDIRAISLLAFLILPFSFI